MEPEFFNELFKSLAWGARTLVWGIGLSIKINRAIRRRPPVYERLATEQSKADAVELRGNPRQEPPRIARIVRSQERST